MFDVQNLFGVQNSLIFAPNLALNDIIAAEEEDGMLHFEQILETSGHSTLQIIFFQPDQSSGVLPRLEALGCNWEGKPVCRQRISRG